MKNDHRQSVDERKRAELVIPPGRSPAISRSELQKSKVRDAIADIARRRGEASDA